MQMDIAVESVLTANAGAPRGPAAGSAPARTRASGTAPASTRRRCAAGVLVVDTEERLTAFCRGMHRSYARGRRRATICPRAVLLAVGADARARRGDRRARPAASSIVAMDNCPHQAVLVGERRRGRPGARDRRSRGPDLRASCPTTAPSTRRCSRRTPRTCARSSRDLPIGAADDARSTRARRQSPYPADAEADPRAARRALDAPGRVPRARSRGCTTRARACSSRPARAGNMTGFIDDILRGRPFCAVPADLPAPLGHRRS